MVLSKPEENGMIDWIDILSKNVFKRLKSESYLCTKKKKNEKKVICILTIYVNDILLKGKNREIEGVRKKKIKEPFNI